MAKGNSTKKDSKKANKKVDKKMEDKKMEDKKGQKVMKRETAKVIDFGPMRRIFNSLLKTTKGLVLVENKHGAIQVKRDGGLLFSARKDGRMIITHPIITGKGKKAERAHKHPGSKWDHLSQVPFDDVTEAMLKARIADKKTAADYHTEFYSGNNKEKSGLYIKTENAKARLEKTLKESGKKKGQIKRDAAAAKTTKGKVAQRSKVTGKGKKAITKVARQPA